MANNVTVDVLEAGNAVEVLVGTGGNIPSKWSVWSAEETYVPMRSVTHLGSSYVCVKANSGVDPEADIALGDGTKGTYWLKTVSKGDAGKEGADGFSPTVEVTKISGGNRITITDAEGTKTFDVMDGSPGKDGEDGFNPTVEVTEISGGHRMTITDAEGTKTFDVMDGKRGADGVAGAPGQNGVSVTHAWEGTVLKVTSASGTSSANLRGPAGADGKDGSDGSPGVDGFSPTVATESVNGGTKITITDKTGAKSFTVWDGLNGEDGIANLWRVDKPESSLTGELLNLKDIVGKPTVDDIRVGDLVISTVDGAVLQVDSVWSAEESPYNVEMVSLSLSYGRLNVTGKDPEDGFSPTVSVEAIEGGNRVSITDKTGTKTFDVMDGERGAAGKDGTSVTHSWNGTVLSVTSASGTSSANLRGPAGADGKDGSAGSPGVDGFSPTVSVEAIEGGNRVSITDKAGTKTFDVMDGEDGASGEGGTGGLLKDDLADGDDLNAEKFYNFEGGMKVFSWPTAGTSGGTLKNAPSGISSSYDLYLICARESADVCTQMMFENIRKGTSSLALNGKNIWMRNREKSNWTAWKKIFPAHGLEGLELKTGDDLNKLDMSGAENIKVFSGVKGASSLTNAPPGKENGNYGPTIINIRNGFLSSSVTQYWIGPENTSFSGAASEVYVRAITGGGTPITEWSKVYPVEAGGAKSWNDLEDRPFRDEIVEVIVPEQEFVFSDNMSQVGKVWPIVSGKTYRVIWDGKAYECVAFDTVYMQAPTVGLGNMAVLGGDDTGEPFLCGVIAAAGISLFGAFDNNTHTASIVEIVAPVKPIDLKYLPKQLQIGEKTVVTKVYPRTAVTVANNQAILENNIALEAGKTYFVTWDGTEYECVAENVSFEGAPGIAVGNPYFTGGSNNGMPFALGHSDYAGVSLAVAMTNGEHTFSVKTENVAIDTIDYKYLPKGVPCVEAVLGSKTIEWDGNTEGKVLSGDGTKVKVSDAMPSPEELETVSFTLSTGDTFKVGDVLNALFDVSVVSVSGAAYIKYAVFPMIVVAYEDGVTYTGSSDGGGSVSFTLPEAGVYFAVSDGSTAGVTSMTGEWTTETVHLLDPKLLPNPSDLPAEWIAALKTALGI